MKNEPVAPSMMCYASDVLAVATFEKGSCNYEHEEVFDELTLVRMQGQAEVMVKVVM